MKFYPNVEAPDVPDDAYGPEYIVDRIREYFDDLIAFTSYDRAQEEVADIVLAARCARRRHHV